MEWLDKVPWDHPGIVGPVAAALTAGVFAIVIAIIKRKKPSNGGAPNITTTANPEFTNAPQTNFENKQSNVFKPIIGLDEKAVGEELGKAVDPLRQEIKSIRDQLAGQLAPKQPVPDSGDPLKIKAVEFFNAGRDAYDEGEIGQARGHWLDSVKLDPDFANAQNNLGNALGEKGELDAAIEHLSAALRTEPDHAIAHNNLGVALREKGELDDANEHYRNALRIDPEFAAARYNLGVALQAKGELDEAIEHYHAALRIEPDYAEARNNLGNVLAAKGELDEATRHLNYALRIDPDYATAHYNIACVLAQKKDASAAVAALAKAIELDPAYRDKAKNDADFDAIRDDPAFRKLVYGE